MLMARTIAFLLAAVLGSLPQAADPWPPAGVHLPHEDGVVLPRVLREVRPPYTPAAMQAKLEGVVALACVVDADGSVGAVRVTRSLDATRGLDDEAVKAAKQWRFSPGTKNGVAVPVLVTLELRFILRAPPAGPTGLPDAFLPAADASQAAPPPDASAWKTETVEDGGLRIGVSYPKEWTTRPASGTRALLVQKSNRNSLWLFDLQRPHATRFVAQGPLPAATLQRFAEQLTQTANASKRTELRGVGQARLGARTWVWVDNWVASPEAWLPDPAKAAAMGPVGGFHLWTFVTTEGDRMITATCSVLAPPDRATLEATAETREAGALFVEILKRISIERLP